MDWTDMSDQARKQLEEQWKDEPGLIDYVIAHLNATPEAILAAVAVMEEIKEKAGPDRWLNTSPEEILYLLSKRASADAATLAET